MRLLFLLTAFVILTSGAALGQPAREIKVERQSTGRDYMTPGTVFQNDLRQGWLPRAGYGDPYAWHDWQHSNRFNNHRHYRQRPGLSIRYDGGDWSAELNTGWRERSHRHYYSSDYYLYGDGWLADSYWAGNRPVYVFGDTRGLERRVVSPRRNYAPLYTAPGYPEYGYYGSQYANRYQYYPDGSADAGAPPQVYNDNRVYNNYYYGDTAEPVQAQPQQAVPAAPAASPPALPSAQQFDPAMQQRAFGQRFHETLKLETPDGTYMFAIREEAMYAGLAEGKPTRLSDSANTSFGGYAAWLPGSGICLFYRVGDQFCLAYPSGEDERWVHEPLPYSVRFGPDTSIGLVGGAPWLSFSTADGSRYVVRYTGRGWEEVGSGTR